MGNYRKIDYLHAGIFSRKFIGRDLVPGFYCGGTDLDGRPARVNSWNLVRSGRLFLKSGFVGLVTSLFPRICFFGEMA